MKPGFEWDSEKAEKNLFKHEVDFNEASSVFDDPEFISFIDDEHSIDEERILRLAYPIRAGCCW